MASRVENRRSGCNLPVAFDCAFASSPQSGLTWLCFLFPLVEPDRRISRIRLSEKTHDVPCDAVCIVRYLLIRSFLIRSFLIGS